MFWDKVAGLYDLFVNMQNGKVNRKLVEEVSGMIEPTDTVLECACGTGMLSKGIAPKCKELIATDFSVGMLKEAKKNPYAASKELLRVCKKGGEVIIPTYINNENTGKPKVFVHLLEKLGANFKQQYDFKSYMEFFEKTGYVDIRYTLIKGKIPCAIAVITKDKIVKTLHIGYKSKRR